MPKESFQLWLIILKYNIIKYNTSVMYLDAVRKAASAKLTRQLFCCLLAPIGRTMR